MSNDVDIEIEGLAEFIESVYDVAVDLEELALDVGKTLASGIATRARAQVTRKTGAAQGSVGWTTKAGKAIVKGGGAGAPYYGWLDFGGQGRPYRRRGRWIYAQFFDLEDSDGIEEQMEDDLVELLERAGLDVE